MLKIPTPPAPPGPHWSRHPGLWLWLGVLIILAVLWGSAGSMARLERQSAGEALRGQGTELADTYEAQALRELRGIEQVLNLVGFAGQTTPPGELLPALERRELLPPEQIYTLRVRPVPSGPQALRSERRLSLRPPVAGHERLGFVRALDGAGRGWQVELEVDAAFFVAGYDRQRLGRRGLQGLLGPDGRALVLRSDTQVRVDTALEAGGRRVWTRPLFGYPLQAVVALDVAEMSAPFEARAASHHRRAGYASAALVLVALALARVIGQLREQRLQFERERLERAQEVERLAFQDALTGLPNRRHFHDIAARAVSGSARYTDALALLFIDLDGFKAVNDSLGHEAGDELLREASQRMQACLRSSDILARLGGDEFAVLLPMQQDLAQIGTVADKLIEAVSAPYALTAGPCRISASIGVARHPGDGSTLDALIRAADAAMYEAKRSGKRAWRASPSNAEAAAA